MRRHTALTALAPILSGLAPAQGGDPSHSSAASGHAAESSKPTSNGTGGGR